MAKRISEALSERLNAIQEVAKTDADLKKAFDHMIQTYMDAKIALIDRITDYPTAEFAEATYARRAKQLLVEYVALDRMYVDRTGEESLYMDNDPTRLVKLFTVYESSLIWSKSGL